MKRRPNPWIVVPSLIAAAVAAWLGGTVAALSCRYGEVGGTLVTLCEVGGSNLAWTVTVAILSFLVVGIGMAVVLVLVFRSIAEWRELQERSDAAGQQPQRSSAAEDQ
ncbi:MAG: hypothetical protein FWJ92_07260 [Actinomycetes bacterium]|nr:hypothetical protein [Acidimicrobiia bacterium]